MTASSISLRLAQRVRTDARARVVVLRAAVHRDGSACKGEPPYSLKPASPTAPGSPQEPLMHEGFGGVGGQLQNGNAT